MSGEPDKLDQILAGVAAVGARVEALESSVRQEMRQVRAEVQQVKSELQQVKAELQQVKAEVQQVRTDFLAELGKTRVELMERMQYVRDDVTVNLSTAQIADKAARSAVDQSREVTDLLYALTRQVRTLEARVDNLRGDSTPH